MSRHEIPCWDANLECEVGWDPPLGTFFAQVYDHARPDPYGDTGLCVWVGTNYGEIPAVAALVQQVSPWAEIDDELRERLERDRLRGPSWPRRLDIEALVASLHLPNHFDAEGHRVELDCPDLP